MTKQEKSAWIKELTFINTELLEGLAQRTLKGEIITDDLKLNDQGNGWKKISFYYRFPPKRN